VLLDPHTAKDLEIFETTAGGTSLFDFCNTTQTKGGRAALRKRMENPFSSPERIKHAQDAITFIHRHRDLFNTLPPAYTSGRSEHFLTEVLPMVTANNFLEFGMGAFSLWMNHDRYYLRIINGVQFTCTVIQALRKFIVQIDTSSNAGELTPLFEEMQILISRPGIVHIPEHGSGRWAWHTLRLDQLIRLQEKGTIVRLLQIVFEIESLLSLADVSHQHGFNLPAVESGHLQVEAEGLTHPFLDNPVANPVTLDQTQRILFLTGPNMAGKTTYLRAFATALYLAHLGTGVPARSFRFSPVEHLFSSISLADDLHGGISYFRAEALRVKAIAEAINDGKRVIALLDEPFKGTNVKDAMDASLAILEQFAQKQDCLFMFSSHLIELSEQLSSTEQIDCQFFEADESGGRLHFDYRLHPGVSSQRLGMRVLREEGIFELLEQAPEES